MRIDACNRASYIGFVRVLCMQNRLSIVKGEGYRHYPMLRVPLPSLQCNPCPSPSPFCSLFAANLPPVSFFALCVQPCPNSTGKIALLFCHTSLPRSQQCTNICAHLAVSAEPLLSGSHSADSSCSAASHRASFLQPAGGILRLCSIQPDAPLGILVRTFAIGGAFSCYTCCVIL